MSFDLDDPTVPKERFGGLTIPLQPFRTAAPVEGDADSTEWARDMARRRCEVASIRGESAEAIQRFAASVQDTMGFGDPIESAKTLARVYWAVRRDRQTPAKERQTALACLSEIAGRSNRADLIYEFVALIGAQAAREEARNPKDKALLEAAARGDEQACRRLKEPSDPLYRNEYLDTIVDAAVAEGWNDAFFSGLKARAEAQLREVERTVAKAIAFRIMSAKDNPSVRTACGKLANSMRNIFNSLDRLDQVNPGNKTFIGDVIGRMLKNNDREFINKEDIWDEVNKLTKDPHVSSHTKTMADRFLEMGYNAVVHNELSHIPYEMTFMVYSFEHLDDMNPDAGRLARHIVARNFKNNDRSHVSAEGLLGEMEKAAKVLGASGAEGLKILRPLDGQDVRDGRILGASGSRRDRGGAGAERD